MPVFYIKIAKDDHNIAYLLTHDRDHIIHRSIPKVMHPQILRFHRRPFSCRIFRVCIAGF